MRVAIALVILAFALTLPYFTYLMGLTGNITGLILAFLLPCYFHIKLKWKTITNKQRFIDVSVIVLSVVCGIVGTWNSVVTLMAKCSENEQKSGFTD